MSEKQSPGGLTIELKYGEVASKWSEYAGSDWKAAKTVSLQPLVGKGIFSLSFDRDTIPAVIMNRSELAALHAAIGELLAFYREFQ